MLASILLVTISFLTTLNPVPAVEASLVTDPASVGNVLIANVGDQISLTCTHEITGTGVTNTIWNITAPVGCLTSLSHLDGALHADCGPFSFKSVSSISPFTSTAVANASLSMTGALVQCVSGAQLMLIGQTTLCIHDVPPPPQNFQCQPMSGGIVRCSWDAVDQDCAMDNISYSLVITDSDGNVTNSTNTTGNMETYALIPGQDYNATLVVFMGDRQSDSTVREFTARDIVTTMSPTTTPPPPVTSPTSPDTLNVTSTCSPVNAVGVGVVAVITFVITAVIMLTMGIVIGALSAICIMKKKSNYSSNAASSGPGPVYDEVSQSKVTFSSDLEMERNMAYGPVKRGM